MHTSTCYVVLAHIICIHAYSSIMLSLLAAENDVNTRTLTLTLTTQPFQKIPHPP
jgi:hypothetical protein